MKLITEEGEIVEGNPVSEGLAKIISDINSNGIYGIFLDARTRKAIVGHIVKNFEVSIRQPEAVRIPEPFEYPAIQPPAPANDVLDLL